MRSPYKDRCCSCDYIAPFFTRDNIARQNCLRSCNAHVATATNRINKRGFTDSGDAILASSLVLVCCIVNQMPKLNLNAQKQYHYPL